MLLNTNLLLILFITFFLFACVSLPTAPSVLALPGVGVSFEQFRYDDHHCKQYAYAQVGGKTPRNAAITSGVESAAIGSAIGAVAGVAIGGGRGAAIGAGTGLLAGGLSGSGSSQESTYMSQQFYDNSYIQCMYAKGHQVPVAGQVAGSHGSRNYNRPSGYSVPPPGRYPSPSVPY